MGRLCDGETFLNNLNQIFGISVLQFFCYLLASIYHGTSVDICRHIGCSGDLRFLGQLMLQSRLINMNDLSVLEPQARESFKNYKGLSRCSFLFRIMLFL